MGCFEDYMQFREDVDEARRKVKSHEAGKECWCKKRSDENDECISNSKVKD